MYEYPVLFVLYLYTSLFTLCSTYIYCTADSPIPMGSSGLEAYVIGIAVVLPTVFAAVVLLTLAVVLYTFRKRYFFFILQALLHWKLHWKKVNLLN